MDLNALSPSNNYSMLCRVCMASDAEIPIFEYENENGAYSRLVLCVGEEIPDIDGYPRNICEACDQVFIETVALINKYKYSQQLFHNLIETDNVKVEIFDEIDIHSILEVPETEPDYYYSEYSTQEVEIETYVDETAVDVSPSNEDEVERGSANNELKPIDNLLKLLMKNKVISVKKTNTKIGNAKSLKRLQNSKDKKSHNESKEEIVLVEEKKSNKEFKEGKKSEEGNDLCEQSSLEPTAELEHEVENNNDDDLDDFQWPLSEPAELDSKKVYTKSSYIQKKNTTGATTSKLCELCGQNFMGYKQYNRHKSHYHGDDEQVKCPVCSKTMSRCKLKRHIECSHGPKTHICHTCGNTYVKAYLLENHIKHVHLNIKRIRTRYECDVCGKSYSTKKILLIHIRSIHTGERPEVCSVCGKRFVIDVYLTEHMRLHTGETPFKCPVCGRGYAQRGNMKSHIKHNHKISDLDEITQKIIHPRYLRLMKP